MHVHALGDLPQDVWLLITHYLPRVQVMQLLAVNHALFNIVLNERYRKVEWIMFDDRVVKNLVRLQDPYVASRVRHLHVRAWFIQHLFVKENLDSPSQTSVLHVLTKRVSRVFKQPIRLNSRRVALRNQSAELASPEEILRAMINAIRHMVNATEYNFEWRDLPLNGYTRRLLGTTWNSFGTTLSKLQFSARVSQFEGILSIAAFKGLEELELHFEFDPSEVDLRDKVQGDGASNEITFVATVAPFINQQSPNLRRLTISSSAEGDHTLLLRQLKPFSCLHHLALRIPFDEDHLSDPSCISRFIHMHKSFITSVELRPNRPPARKDFLLFPPKWKDNWSTLTKHCLANIAWLGNLDSLTLPALDQQTTLAILRHTSMSLSSLCLLERYMNMDDLKEIVDSLSSHTGLRMLSLEVMELSPQLFILLANSVPLLHSLTLVLGLLSADAYNDIDWVSAGYIPLYHWSLFDLSIFIRNSRPSSMMILPETRTEENLMHELNAFVLPRVQSHKGRMG